MISLVLLCTVLASFVASAWLTGRVRRYALASALLDHPNERSSHTHATPRGGGVAIVCTCLTVTALLASSGHVSVSMMSSTLVAGSAVALLGFLDDRHNVAARWRFLGHLFAASWVVGSLPHLASVHALGIPLDRPVLGHVLSGLFLVWMINLFNFMDGIDGIASLEAITVCVSGTVLWALTTPGSNWLVPATVAACAGGFLVWNFPPARIFMGDAGSGFLGLMVAACALHAGTERPDLLWSWLILCGCFTVDATTTLIRRVRRGCKFYVAHRSHAYQYASRRFGRHLPVTLAVGVINLAWLWPVAGLVAFGHLEGLWGLTLAYAPLVVLAYYYKAGDAKAQEAA